MSTTYRQVHLARRPSGTPTLQDFEIVERPRPTPGAGEILVENLFMSVDPYMRGRMRDTKSYVPSFQVGQVLDGASVGRVIESGHDDFPVGTHVLGRQGWRELYVSNGQDQQRVEAGAFPLSAYLGVLGMPGMTAYVGLFDIGKPKQGETLLVSAAAGAVGSLVGQLGKIAGCRVVGSAGSQDKVDHLVHDLGFDAAINYRDGSLGSQLDAACPDGIDIYFENVGGAMLEAVLPRMRPFGRIPVCGMISLYNEEQPPPGPRTLISVIPNRLTLRGFIVSDHADRRVAFQRDVAGWLEAGRLQYRETVLQGIEKAPEAFLGLFDSRNTGKMVIQLSDG